MDQSQRVWPGGSGVEIKGNAKGNGQECPFHTGVAALPWMTGKRNFFHGIPQHLCDI